MLPGDRGHPDETGGAGRVAAAFLVSQQMREDGGVVRDDAIGVTPRNGKNRTLSPDAETETV
jgi:hypothetical protein